MDPSLLPDDAAVAEAGVVEPYASVRRVRTITVYAPQTLVVAECGAKTGSKGRATPTAQCVRRAMFDFGSRLWAHNPNGARQGNN